MRYYSSRHAAQPLRTRPDHLPGTSQGSPGTAECALSPLSGQHVSLWKGLNAPASFDPRTVRIASLVLTATYLVVAILRHDPSHAGLGVALRALVCAYGVAGALLASRMTWTTLRVYTIGVALLLPLVTTTLNGLQGHPLATLPFLALASFVPFVFVLTGQDLVVSTASSALLQSVAVALFPPTAITPAAVAIVIGTGMATGVVAGFALLVYRTRLAQSLAWWQDACTRERQMREFGELTASSLRGDLPLDRFAEQLRAAYAPDAGCVIVLADESGGFRVASAVDAPGIGTAPVGAGRLPPHLAALLWEIVAEGTPLTHETMPARLRDVIEHASGQRRPMTSSLALPVVVDDIVAGLVWLFSPQAPCPSPEGTLALKAMVGQLGVALANVRLVERLRRALRAKSEFLNTMSHELRSPLHVILGYAEMIAAEAGAQEIAAWCSRIGTSARELLQLVENTMNAARLDAGKVTLHEEVFFADDLVSELADAIRALPEGQRGTPVHWHLAPGVSALRLDRLKVKEILQNLISNALKFTRHGEVAVTIDQDGPNLRVAVRDTGEGIPVEAQARIFDMFERVEDPTRAQRPSGVGLGLHIVRSLVALMGGRVDVTSEPGKGSCFTVRLPLARSACPS